jgi:fructosamine-3-kinase
MDDGWRFFAQCRLLPQARRAFDGGRLTAEESQAVERICARLPELIPLQPPVLLHGDLWLGNLHCCGDGMPALIDAGAVHWGWAEAEQSMLTLFGAPPEAFWNAYAEVCAPDADWRERAPLYNLYHLLNHLNLFGASYLDGVREVLRRFA